MNGPLHLIVNPTSGKGRAGQLLPTIVSRFEQYGHEVAVTTTRSLEHGQSSARSVAETGSTVVAVGGDGLVSAVAASLSTLPEPGPLGIIPMGRGNDFARWLGIVGLRQAIEVVHAGATRRVDLGSIDGRRFTCGVAMGLDSRVIHVADRVRLVGGRLVYPYATLKALYRWRPVDFQLELDGVATELRGYSVVVANSGSYGGGMRVAPAADLSDGLFDVVTIADMSRLRFLLRAGGVFRGTHVRHPEVEVRYASRVVIRTDSKVEAYADGELVGPAPLVLEVIPHALTVIVP